MTETDPVRVLIVDDQQVFVFALRELLGADERIEVVGVTDSATDAIEIAANDEVDVVLMDMTMPGIGGLEATRRLRAKAPRTQVIVVSGWVDRADEVAAKAAGAAGFMCKGGLVEEIGDAVVRASAASRAA